MLPIAIARDLTFSFVCGLVVFQDARWRRGEAVSMASAREQMLTYEQLQYIPKPKI